MVHRNLLVINYAMDPEHPVFAHQYEIVLQLSRKFEKVTVITGQIGNISVPSNVTVEVSNWSEGKGIRNISLFLQIFLRAVKFSSPDVIFSHMTDVQASIAAPIAYFLRIPHYLWYAHAHHSIYLRWSSLWCQGLISSSEGSFPFKSDKLNLIGQSIDSEVFVFHQREFQKIKKFVHVGRLDPSKNIIEIISTVRTLRISDSEITLTLVGSPSSHTQGGKYIEMLRREASSDLNWLQIVPHIPRNSLPAFLSGYDCFIHAYRGSLDKVLIEAAMCGLPVTTINAEFCNLFGSWTNSPTDLSLLEEVNSLLQSDSSQISQTVLNFRELAIENHSLDSWIKKLIKILTGKFS